MSAVDYASSNARAGKTGRALHVIAVLTACATFPLIFMGGLVTSKHAGLSVPDWPNSYGYNMFLFPPKLWVGGILYEHTHRLMGTVVGMLSIVLTIVAWKTESRRWVRWVATCVLGAVIFQGVLGGLRVVLVKLDLAIVHACVAQAFFCLTAFMALITSRWWIENVPGGGADTTVGDRASADGTDIPVGGRTRYSAADIARGKTRVEEHLTPSQTRMSVPPKSAYRTDRPFFIACGLAVVIIYAQLIVGAVMRHEQAGLAIPDFPTTYGKILPPTTTAEVNAINLQHLDSPNYTLAQMWLSFGHRIGALLVTIALITVILMAIRRRIFLRTIATIAALLVVQITLGILTVLLKKPADVASAHVAIGALVLMSTFVLAVRAYLMQTTRQPVAIGTNELDEKAIGVFA